MIELLLGLLGPPHLRVLFYGSLLYVTLAAIGVTHDDIFVSFMGLLFGALIFTIWLTLRRGWQ